MTVRKRGGRWHFDFMIRRVRYRGTLPEARTKQQAHDAEAKKRLEVFEGTFGQAKGTDSFIEYAERSFLPWSRTNKRSWKADEDNVKVLKQYFSRKSFREITPMLVEKFKRDRLKAPTRAARQRSVASVNRELACISKIFSRAIFDGRASFNPCSRVKKYREHNERNRYLLPEEEERLLAKLTGPRAHLCAVVQLAINTGMRRGEILGMRWPWVDFARGYIHIPGENSKNGKPRSIPINGLVREVLQSLQRTGAGGGLVVVSPKTGRTLTDIKHGFVGACVDAGIADFRFHDLRHTFATRLADAGADPFVIAEILGHSDLRMTKRYTHATDQRKRQAVERLADYGKQPEKRSASLKICHNIVTMETRKVG